MTKKFFESFKKRFGEVAKIYFNDPLEEYGWRHRLDFESDKIYVENVEWEKDAVTFTYIELMPYIDCKSGNNKCHKERKVQHIKRENIHTVLFRQF